MRSHKKFWAEHLNEGRLKEKRGSVTRSGV